MSEGKSILLVDDEVDLSEVLAEILELSGFDCAVAPGVDEAIEMIRNNTYHAIISDVRMPEKTGVDLLYYIKENDMMPEAFYFISGFSDLNEETAKELGASGLFSKPFKVEEILNALKSELKL